MPRECDKGVGCRVPGVTDLCLEWAMGTPSTEMRPVRMVREFPGSWPASVLRRVVFPLPEGPMMARSRPGWARPHSPLNSSLLCTTAQEHGSAWQTTSPQHSACHREQEKIV